MATLQLGPLALPLNPLLMLLGWWMASWLTDSWMRAYPESARRQAARALMLSVAVGLLASRAGFVAMAWEPYTADPSALNSLLQILNLRDGGWLPEAGAAAALGVLLACIWRYPLTRRALALGSGCGVAFWALASLVLGVHERAPLPRLNLASLSGPQIALHAQQGSPMVINLWASWCAPCVVEMPVFAQAQQRHTGIRFVFVNQGESASVVRSFVQRQGYRLDNVVLDPEQQLSAAVRSSALPTTLFVDAEGRVLERHIGPLSAASLEGRLSGLR